MAQDDEEDDDDDKDVKNLRCLAEFFLKRTSCFADVFWSSALRFLNWGMMRSKPKQWWVSSKNGWPERLRRNLPISWKSCGCNNSPKSSTTRFWKGHIVTLVLSEISSQPKGVKLTQLLYSVWLGLIRPDYTRIRIWQARHSAIALYITSNQLGPVQTCRWVRFVFTSLLKWWPEKFSSARAEMQLQDVTEMLQRGFVKATITGNRFWQALCGDAMDAKALEGQKKLVVRNLREFVVTHKYRPKIWIDISQRFPRDFCDCPIFLTDFIFFNGMSSDQ